MSSASHAGSIHGHEILDLIRTTTPAPTAGEVADIVEARYGPEARFHTCSAQEMTLKELLQFLFARTKIVLRDDGRLHVQIENVCSH